MLELPVVVYIVLLSFLAGAAMPAGGLLARFDLMHPALLGENARRFIVAFGGGALVSAVALVLVPEGAEVLSPAAASLCFMAGGIAFYLLEKTLARMQSSAGQLVAMLSDFIPEAIALGAAFAVGERAGFVLALLMILQNLPEGFNAYEELVSSTELSPKVILLAFGALSLTGPACALVGYYLLAEAYDGVAALMLFASAGILYLVFQDIAPGAKSQNTSFPALGAVVGFLFGLVGNMLIAGS